MFISCAILLPALASLVAGAALPVRREIMPNMNCGPDYCAGTLNNVSAFSIYICGDPRLGPTVLPTALPLSTLVETYDRLGGLCPGPYLSTWTDINGSYVYPPLAGFSIGTNLSPISGNMSLTVGTYVDRFGSEGSRYLAPAGAPYLQRALPPSNLNVNMDGDLRYPSNYHVYVVIAPFSVVKGTPSFDIVAGPIAPWFGQSGQGTQYFAYSSVADLVLNGYLARVDSAQY